MTLGTIQLDGGTLTDAFGLTITSGTPDRQRYDQRQYGDLGRGGGYDQGLGGTLDILGTVNSGPTLAIDTIANSTLKLDGTATAAAALALNNANQKLEIGAAGQSDDQRGAERFQRHDPARRRHADRCVGADADRRHTDRPRNHQRRIRRFRAASAARSRPRAARSTYLARSIAVRSWRSIPLPVRR